MSTIDASCDSCSDAQLISRWIYNSPAQSGIKYRVGTFGQFRQSMFVDLSQSLANLRTRSNDDLAIGLVDGWATLSDIITFYQERIANEAYLRTATEKKSILELARTVGYELRPGVAATAYLAFTIDKTVDKTIIDVGTKIQSIPAQGQKPQVFETIGKMVARPEWNSMPVKTTTCSAERAINNILNPTNGNAVVFQAINLKLRIGDGLLVTTPDSTNFLIITKVEEDTKANQTTIEFVTDENSNQLPQQNPPGTYDISVFRTRCNIFGYNSPMQGVDLPNIACMASCADCYTQQYNATSTNNVSSSTQGGAT